MEGRSAVDEPQVCGDVMVMVMVMFDPVGADVPREPGWSHWIPMPRRSWLTEGPRWICATESRLRRNQGAVGRQWRLGNQSNQPGK